MLGAVFEETHWCAVLRRAMHARAECPICRAPLRAEDLFDAATEEEVEAQRLESEHTGNYGAKVGAALTCVQPYAVLQQVLQGARPVLVSSVVVGMR